MNENWTGGQLEQFNQVLLRYLQPPSNMKVVPADMDLMKLGLDSMMAVSLLLDLESEFDVIFPAELITVRLFSSTDTLRLALASLMKPPC